MNKSKAPAIILTVLSIGALQETFRIFTSNDDDIVQDRMNLSIMSSVITLILIGLALVFWFKKPSPPKK